MIGADSVGKVKKIEMQSSEGNIFLELSEIEFIPEETKKLHANLTKI